MSRLLTPGVVIFFALCCSAPGATATRSVAASFMELAIDGVSCGDVRSCEGGDPRTSVVVEKPMGVALLKKHIGAPDFAPITVEIPFPLAQAIVDWIADLGANRQTRKTLLLTEYDSNRQPVGSALQVLNTLLTEVRFPVIDVASKDPAYLTLVFTPESTHAAPASSSTTSAGAATKLATLANFRIQIGGLPTSRVSRIEAFTIKQAYTVDPVGVARSGAVALPPPEFSNLTLTLSNVDAADWNAWRDNFVVSGNSDDASEKSGSLELLSSDLTPLLTLQLSHVGIIRASRLKWVRNAETTDRFQAELYCEGMMISGAPAQPVTFMPVALATATAEAFPAGAPTGTSSGVSGAESQGRLDQAGAGQAAGGAAAAAAGGSSGAGPAAAGDGSAAAALGKSLLATVGGGAAQGAAAVAQGGSAAVAALGDRLGAAIGALGTKGAAAGGVAGAAQAAAGQETSGGASQGGVAGGGAGAAAGSAASDQSATAAGAAQSGAETATIAAVTTSPLAVSPAGITAATPGTAMLAPVSPPTSAPTVTNPADQGGRDPKDFPRAEGSVRKSFTSTRQKTLGQEMAAYSVTATLDALEEFFTASLTASNWELVARNENNFGTGGRHQVVIDWKNALRSARVTLIEFKDAPAEVGVSLTTTFVPR